MTHDIITNVVYTSARVKIVTSFFNSLRIENFKLQCNDYGRIVVTLSEKDMLFIKLRYGEIDDILTHLNVYIKENLRKVYNLQLSERFNLSSVLEKSDGV